MPAETAALLGSPPRRVHVVGVGGAGMSALAAVLAAMGHQVSGSDLQAGARTERLRRAGVQVHIGHAAEHVEWAELVTASPAVGPDNPELAEAARRGIPVASRAELLAALGAWRATVAVAGTHGKTTTASMLTLALRQAGLRPSFVVGAEVDGLGTNGLLDTGEWLVLEADESYGAFELLSPAATVLTSVEPDHLDHYRTLERLQGAFARLLEATAGPRLVSADDPGAAALGRGAGVRLVGEAEGATYRIDRVVLGAATSQFALEGPTGTLEVGLSVPGRHNVANAALAAAGALELGAGPEAVAEALAGFTGAPRRYQWRGEVGGVRFVDDYGHLPGEVAATLATARLAGCARVVAVFQPHRYTRTALLAGDFAHAFDDADVVVVTDVYSAGEPPIPGVSGRLVVDALVAARPGRPVHYAADRDELVALVASVLGPGDLCVTLGAGDLTTLPDQLAAVLAR
jgi:UDP-N-acetylmuramate--alanine ligase